MTPSSRLLLVLAALLAQVACDPSLAEQDEATCAGLQCTAGECFSNAGQPMCRCGGWELAAGLECAVGTFSELDEHGGSPATATALSLPMFLTQGSIQAGSREGMVDRDLFAFTAEAGHFYALRCMPVSLPGCYLRLLDARGYQATAFFDGSGTGQVLYATLEPGPWYLEVSGGEHVGTYLYQAEDLGLDDHAGTREEATVLQATHGEPFPVTHAFYLDRDVFTFHSLPGHGYRFSCEPPDGPGPGPRDLHLALTSDTGAVVDSAGFASGGSAVGLQVEWEADWYVELQMRDGVFPARSCCRLEDLGLDEHANAPVGATPVALGRFTAVTLQSKLDVDVLSFQAEAGHVYTVRTEEAGSWTARVLGARGETLKAGTTQVLGFEPGAAGTYFLALEGGLPWLHSFHAVVVDLGPDDHGDGQDEASPIAPGGTATGRFETAQDVDAFHFTAAADGIYLATCEPACDLIASAPDRMSTERPGWGSYLMNASWVTPVTLLLKTGGADAYTLRLEQVGTDDYGDDASDAMLLPLPAAISGKLQTAVDADTFAVDLVGGRTYRLGLELGPPRLSLSGPALLDAPMGGGPFIAKATGRYLLKLYGAQGMDFVPWSFTLREE